MSRTENPGREWGEEEDEEEVEGVTVAPFVSSLRRSGHSLHVDLGMQMSLSSGP